MIYLTRDISRFEVTRRRAKTFLDGIWKAGCAQVPRFQRLLQLYDMLCFEVIS